MNSKKHDIKDEKKGDKDESNEYNEAGTETNSEGSKITALGSSFHNTSFFKRHVFRIEQKPEKHVSFKHTTIVKQRKF